MKRHAERFAKLQYLTGEIAGIRKYLADRNYKFRHVSVRYCKKRTSSNHCWNCLLCPLLLTVKPWKAECFCADHVAIWAGENKLVLGRPGYGCKCYRCVDGCSFKTLGALLDNDDDDTDDSDDTGDEMFCFVELSDL